MTSYNIFHHRRTSASAIRRLDASLRHMTVIIFSLFILLSGQSCSHEELVSPPETEHVGQVTLMLRIPDLQHPENSALRAGVKEQDVMDISMAVTRMDSGTEKIVFIRRLTHSEFRVMVFYGKGYVVQRLPVGSYHRFVLVANDPTPAGSDIFAANGITVGMSYDAIKSSQLPCDKSIMQTDGWQEPLIPMYGELKASVPNGFTVVEGENKVLADQAHPVSLRRMLAKIQIANNDPAFHYNDILLVYANKKGCIYYDVEHPTQATIPTSPEPFGAAERLQFSQPALPDIPGGYITECLNSGGANSPRIILDAGAQGYYPLDFVDDGSHGNAKGLPLPILRNRLYKFTIKSIKGPGYSTLQDAIAAPYGKYTNADGSAGAGLHVVDMDYRHSTFDGENYLDVSQLHFSFFTATTNSSTPNKTFTIQTDVPGGWSIKIYDAQGVQLNYGWLRVSSQSGSTGKRSVDIQLYNAPHRAAGYIEITAGKLKTRIQVNVVGHLPIEYVSEYNAAGGMNLGSHHSTSYPYDSNVICSGWKGILGWAASIGTDDSGYYNWYVRTGTYDYKYNKQSLNLFTDTQYTSGKLKDYHEPTINEWFAIWGSANGTDSNDPIEYGGHKETARAKSMTSSGTTYALRYLKATGNPIGSATAAEYPLVTDNSMACAMRYRYLGSFSQNNNTSSILEISCIYVGDMNPLPELSAIANDAWWNMHAERIIMRYFPACGHIEPAVPGQKKGTLYNRGYQGCYSARGLESGHNIYFQFTKNGGINREGIDNNDKKSRAISVRPFKNSL